MPIQAFSYTAYLRGNFSMRNVDFAGQKVVKALKDEEINKYAVIPIRGQNFRFDNNSRQSVARLWAQWAADKIRAQGFENCVIAPVPNTCAVVGAPATFGTYKMAHALATELGRRATLHDALRWTAAAETAHAGSGARRPEQLYPNLTYQPAAHAHPYILVDDVVTSGGHIRACRTHLEQRGKQVSMAICGAQTVYAQLDNVFNLEPFEIDDFDPDDPQGLRALFQPVR